MTKVNRETAIQTVTEWLDFKKVKATKREGLASMIESLIEAVMEGTLVVDDNMNFIQKLDFPLTSQEGSVMCESLTFKPRITDKEIQSHSKAVKGQTFSDELTKRILALTGENFGYIQSLDSSTDRPLAENIAVFFM
jgi:hypothetical protein